MAKEAPGSPIPFLHISYETLVSLNLASLHKRPSLRSETLDLRFQLPLISDMNGVLEDDFTREIIKFHVDMVPTNSSGKGS